MIESSSTTTKPTPLEPTFVTDPNKLNSLNSSTDSVNVRDGCIVLGSREQDNDSHQYVTRFRIHRDEQREASGEGLCLEEYCPCRLSKNRSETAGKQVWNVISSEAFVLTLHMTVLGLGVAKECLDLRTVDEDLELIHSLLETFVTVLVILIRTGKVWSSFKGLKELRKSFEVIEGDAAPIHDPGLKRLFLMNTSLSSILMLIAVGCFFMFEFVPGMHLGWTILSNNAVLLVATVSSSAVLSRSSKETASMLQDNHKAVIYESVLLLSDACMAQSPEQKRRVYPEVDRFIKALLETESFKKPEYITCPTKFKLRLETFNTMEVVSMV